MRLVCAVSGFVEVLARLLAAQRRLEDQSRGSFAAESVEVVRGGYYEASGVSVHWSHASGSSSSSGSSTSTTTTTTQSLDREVETVLHFLGDDARHQNNAGVSRDESWEACLPQVTTLLLELAPKSRPLTTYYGTGLPWEYAAALTHNNPAGGQQHVPGGYDDWNRRISTPSPLVGRLRDSLVARCGRSSQLGLEACWLLQDSLGDRPSAWGARLARDCWRASARAGSRDSAALAASLVRISEALAKVDRSKRREHRRVAPLLEAVNVWLAARATPNLGGPNHHTPLGVRLPLAPLSSGRQIRILRFEITTSRVMPSRARAPLLLYCEALDLTDDDDDNSARRKFVDPFVGGGTTTSSSTTTNAAARGRSSSNNNNHHGSYHPNLRRSTTSRQTPVFLLNNNVDTTGRSLVFPPATPLLREVYSPCWLEKEAVLRQKSRYAHLHGWRMASFLVKADDDLRREQLATQAVALLNEIFARENVRGFWLRPYGVVCAGRRSGLVETLPDAKSIDHAKRTLQRIQNPGKEDAPLRSSASLGDYFDLAYGPGDANNARFRASENFARSLASYSVLCYALDVKDRHNGNLLLDAAGRVIHIDFGYSLGLSPGNINFESAPFKLTQDYVDVMLGFESPAFATFVDVFTHCLHALYLHRHQLHYLLLLNFQTSPKKTQHLISHNLASKFADLDGDFRTTRAVANGLIREALQSERTKQYDWYQWKTNKIVM